jgi:hypothetical protein
VSTDRDVNRIVRSWLDEGVTVLPDRVLDAVLDQLPATPQRRAVWLVRRFPLMNNSIVRFGLAAAAVVAIAVIGVNLVPGGGSGAQPTPSPSTSPSAQPSPDLYGTQVHDGLLDPGTYAYLDVDHQGFNVRFVVPAGWTWNGRYLSKGGVGLPGGAAIFFFGGPVQVYADPCHWAGEQASPPTDFSSRSIVAALAAQASRSATSPISRPVDLFVGGASVELTVPEGINFADCDGGEFRSWGPQQEARSAQGPGQRDLVWAVDVLGIGFTDGSPPTVGGLIIDAAWFPQTPASVRAEITAILGSIRVGHWG